MILFSLLALACPVSFLPVSFHDMFTRFTCQILGMPDSGFWPDDTAEYFSKTFRKMFEMQNGTVDILDMKFCLCVSFAYVV
jgi:hypothetical protein